MLTSSWLNSARLNSACGRRVLVALLAMTAMSASLPAGAWSFGHKKTEKPAPTYNQSDSTYQYVSGVFDKMQTYWQKQATDQRVIGNETVTFTLNSVGDVINSRTSAPQVSAAEETAGQDALNYIKQQGSFGAFPESVNDNRLEFVFKLSPESMQMVSYKFVPKTQREDNVISMATPTSSAPAATSLFYARVVDASESPRNGKVVEGKSDSKSTEAKQSANEQSMQQYIGEVRDRIRQNWRQPEDALTFSPAMALLQIDRDGSLLSATLTQSSGNKNIDRAIMNTIYQAGPFNQAPDALQSLPVTVEYVFEPVVSTVYEQPQAPTQNLP